MGGPRRNTPEAGAPLPEDPNVTWIAEEYPAMLGPLPDRHRLAAEEEPRRQRLLLTISEAAEQLTISRTEMWRMIRRGFIPIVKIGRLTRIRPEALVAFVDSFETGR